jgi:hypothetical protein
LGKANDFVKHLRERNDEVLNALAALTKGAAP